VFIKYDNLDHKKVLGTHLASWLTSRIARGFAGWLKNEKRVMSVIEYNNLDHKEVLGTHPASWLASRLGCRAASWL
jgi:hypothetical protein